MIIDYSTARPPFSVLKEAGVTAAGRYIGWDGVPGFASIGKNLTRAEAGHLLAENIAIFVAFEYEATAALKGRDQGLKDGHLASEQLAALGAPAGMTVYFALDFDIGDFAPHLPAGTASARAKLGPAAAYFDGIHAAKPAYAVGAYGGYWAISRLFDAGLIAMGWQTVAWSGDGKGGTLWDKRAVIRQEPGRPVAGADLDTVRLNTASGPDFGQWPRPRTAAARPELETHVTAGHMSAHDLAQQRGISFPHMCRLTTDYFGHWPPETYAWLSACADPLSAVNIKATMPAGLTWRCPRLPS